MTQIPRRTGFVVLALVALLAVVAIAATGPAPTGAGGAQPPSHWALDVIASLILVALVPGSILLVFMIFLRPEALREAGSARGPKRGRFSSLAGLTIAVVLIVLAVRHLRGAQSGSNDPAGGGQGPGAGRVPARDDLYEPSFALVPVLVTLAVIVAGIVAAMMARRARRDAAGQEAHDVSTALGDVLDEALDDLRAEVDPRRAVIAAYARLERVLAAYGVPRRPSEAPEEYLERVLAGLDISRPAVTRLTSLFETAKFSQHDVGASMKEEAIGALETARDELRLTAERERIERESALAIDRERAAV